MGTPVVRRGGGEPSWMRPITERLSPVVKALVIINAALFFFYAMVKEAQVFFQEHLAIGPGVLRGELWQPVSSLFVHVDFLSFAFNLIGLWFVGATIERALGTRRFLTLFFGAGILSNVVMVAVAVLLGAPQLFPGCGNAVLALFVAFGTIYDRQPARVLGGLVVQARVLAMILVGFAVLADLSRGAWAMLAGDLVAILMGYTLAGGRGESLKRGWTGWRAKRVRRRYQILEGGRGANERKPRRTPYVN
jgi:membrane associated rhomboid family serine protease